MNKNQTNNLDEKFQDLPDYFSLADVIYENKFHDQLIPIHWQSLKLDHLSPSTKVFLTKHCKERYAVASYNNNRIIYLFFESSNDFLNFTLKHS